MIGEIAVMALRARLLMMGLVAILAHACAPKEAEATSPVQTPPPIADAPERNAKKTKKVARKAA